MANNSAGVGFLLDDNIWDADDDAYNPLLLVVGGGVLVLEGGGSLRLRLRVIVLVWPKRKIDDDDDGAKAVAVLATKGNAIIVNIVVIVFLCTPSAHMLH